MARKARPDRPIGRVDFRESPSIAKKPLLKHSQTLLAKEGQKPHLCQVRIDGKLLEAIRNAVQSAKIGGDFCYGNVSDFIRAALTAYKDGMKLVEVLPAADNQVQGTTVWMDDALYTFWRSLPYGCRREILERALRTKLKQNTSA